MIYRMWCCCWLLKDDAVRRKMNLTLKKTLWGLLNTTKIPKTDKFIDTFLAMYQKQLPEIRARLDKARTPFSLEMAHSSKVNLAIAPPVPVPRGEKSFCFPTWGPGEENYQIFFVQYKPDYWDKWSEKQLADS